MSSSPLRPPLPPPRTHEGITFLSPGAHPPAVVVPSAQRLPDATVAAIAAALTELLGAGDFTVDTNGVLIFSECLATTQAELSAWSATARLEAIERATLL